MKRVFFFLGPMLGLIFTGCGGKLAGENEIAELWESFEEESGWMAVSDSWGDGDRSLDAVLSSDWASLGEYALECSFSMDGSNRAASYLREYGPGWDWSDVTAVGLDLKNNTKMAVRVAAAVCSGDKWYWQESVPVEADTGVTRNLRFDFYTASLKSEATNWESTANLSDPHAVKRVIFRVYASGGENPHGSVFLDNVRIVKKVK